MTPIIEVKSSKSDSRANIVAIYLRMVEDIGLPFTQVPKVLQYRFLIHLMNSFGGFISFEWLDYEVQCQNVSTNNCNLQKE